MAGEGESFEAHAAIEPSTNVREYLIGSAQTLRQLGAYAEPAFGHPGIVSVHVTVVDYDANKTVKSETVSESRLRYEGDGAELRETMQAAGFSRRSIETFNAAVFALWALT